MDVHVVHERPHSRREAHVVRGDDCAILEDLYPPANKVC